MDAHFLAGGRPSLSFHVLMEEEDGPPYRGLDFRGLLMDWRVGQEIK
jgi:hypothetical protein